MYRIFFLVVLAFIFSCNEAPPPKVLLQTGPWHFVMDLGETVLEINTAVIKEDVGYRLLVKNADEIISADEFEVNGDTILIKMPAFETEFHALHNGDSLWGVMQDYSRGGEYTIPFYGKLGEKKCEVKKVKDYSGRWEAYFGVEGDDIDKPNAIGVFEQDGNKITGTFMTETGDYRYLEGCVTEGGFSLNTFDGAHAFRFDVSDADLAGFEGKKGISGTFYSGKHYQEKWFAVRNDSVSLRSPEELTYLNPGYDGLAFTFPDVDGKDVSLTDSIFQNKAVIVQIMGSWCPNCLDESKLYSQWYKKYRSQGLEIVALAFEKHTEFDKASASVTRLADRLDIQYPMLIAGKASKTEAAEKLPMLNHVLSFPTSIFIDKKGKVRKIHTGFNGPGTGKYFDEFVETYEALIEEMLGE